MSGYLEQIVANFLTGTSNVANQPPRSLTLIRIVANCCELAKVANEPGRSGNRCHLIDRRSSHPHDYLAHKHIHDRNERLNADPLRAGPSRRETADPLSVETFRASKTRETRVFPLKKMFVYHVNEGLTSDNIFEYRFRSLGQAREGVIGDDQRLRSLRASFFREAWRAT